jgi:hypothetical protein
MQMKNTLEISNIIKQYQKKSQKRKAFEMKNKPEGTEVKGKENKKAVFKYKFNVGYSNAVIRKVKMSFFIPKQAKAKS